MYIDLKGAYMESNITFGITVQTRMEKLQIFEFCGSGRIAVRSSAQSNLAH